LTHGCELKCGRKYQNNDMYDMKGGGRIKGGSTDSWSTSDVTSKKFIFFSGAKRTPNSDDAGDVEVSCTKHLSSSCHSPLCNFLEFP
jgi:hypothetical protein